MKGRTRPAQAVAQCVAAALCGACGIVTAMPPAFAATPAVHTVTVQGAPSSRPAVDPRSFMHGIGVADAGNGKRWVFFSSSGIVPRGAMRGDIFVTFEDGWNAPQEVSQRYGVYRRDLKPIKPYPNDVESGGHSGHVATAADRFVVFYSADWVDGGGVDNLGTGNGVYVKTYDAAGRVLNHVAVVPHRREWWPVVAGSPHTALLVWQKYIEGSTDAALEYAMFDPVTAKLDKLGTLNDAIQYYVYSSAYVPEIDRFIVVTTTADDRGVAMLIAPDGRRTATLDCLPASVRESGIGVSGSHAYVPIRDGRLLTLALGPANISVSGVQRSPIPWGLTGIAGFPGSGTAMHFVSLTPSGTREADFDPAHETPLPKNEVPCSSH